MTLSNEVECDEAYVVAGHKGHPEVVKSKGRKGRRRRRKSKAGRGTLEKEKPPVFGMIERGGQVVIHLLANVKQKTIEPLMQDTIESGTLVYTDEYSIYARLETWGYAHKSVNHGRGEYARDEDGDGFCEVHVNTMEALVGFQGLMLAWAFGRLNPFIKLLKNNAFKDDAGRANRVVRHGYIHDPGMQQEPLNLRWCNAITL